MMTATNSDKVNAIVAGQIRHEAECWFTHGHCFEWKAAQMTLAAVWRRFDSAESAVASAEKTIAYYQSLNEPPQNAPLHVRRQWAERAWWIASYERTLADARTTLEIRRAELAAAQADFDEKQRIVDMRAGR